MLDNPTNATQKIVPPTSMFTPRFNAALVCGEARSSQFHVQSTKTSTIVEARPLCLPSSHENRNHRVLTMNTILLLWGSLSLP